MLAAKLGTERCFELNANANNSLSTGSSVQIIVWKGVQMLLSIVQHHNQMKDVCLSEIVQRNTLNLTVKSKRSKLFNSVVNSSLNLKEGNSWPDFKACPLNVSFFINRMFRFSVSVQTSTAETWYISRYVSEVSVTYKVGLEGFNMLDRVGECRQTGLKPKGAPEHCEGEDICQQLSGTVKFWKSNWLPRGRGNK